MTKVGIIRCDEHSNACAGYNCFPALRDKTGMFARYETVELVGYDTCGGCPRNNTKRIVDRAQRLKDKGAEVIHLANCIIIDCPWKDYYAKAIAEKVQLPIVERTHAAPPNAKLPVVPQVGGWVSPHG